MAIKIDKTDISWHADQPNKPAKTGDEMKAFFDAPIEILRQKINEVIDDADATAPDQSYNGASDRPQSGTAVAEAVNPLILEEMSATKPHLDNVLPLLEAIEKHKQIVICGEDGAKYFADAAYTDDTYIYVEYSALSADGEIEKRRARYGRDGVAAERLYSYKPQKLTVDQTYDSESTHPQSGKAVAEALESNKRYLTTMIAEVDKSAKEIFDDVEILKTDKQNKLIAGENITIEGNLISADVGAADQTYDAASENAQSGKAVAEALETKQDALTAGNNITIENGVISASGGGGNVNDVQIAGTSIVKDGIADIPVSRKGVNGVASAGYALSVNTSGEINAYAGYDSLYTSRGAFCVVGSNFDKIVKLAMCDGKGAAWTADEQEAAKDRLGIGKTTFSGTQFGTSVAISDLSGIAPNHVNITLSLQAQSDAQTDTYLNGGLGFFVNNWTYGMTTTKKVVNMDCFATVNGVYRVSVLLYDDNGGLPEDAYESFVKQDFFISLSNLQNMAFSCSDVNTGESVSLNLEYSGYYEL